MKNEQDEKLDNLFKKRLENPDQLSGYREEDWDALENILDQHKKRRGIVYLLPLLSSVAAIMLLFTGWWLFGRKANNINEQHKPQFANIAVPGAGNRKMDNGTKQEDRNAEPGRYSLPPRTANEDRNVNGKNMNKASIKIDTLLNNTRLLAATSVNKSKDSVYDKAFANKQRAYRGPAISRQPAIGKWRNKNPLAILNYSGLQVNKNSAVPLILNNQPPQNNIASISIPGTDYKLPANASSVSALKAPAVKVADQLITSAEKSEAALMKLLARTTPPDNLSAKTRASFKPRFTGGIIGAQDINGAGSFKQGKFGSKAGLVFAAGVSQKFTISTGAVYSSTPYSAGDDSFDLPYQPKVTPVSLSANCQMLDIPVNVGFLVYNKGKNAVSFGTGLSSYIMLQQDYNFVYASSSGVPPHDYSVPNSSSYLFKILNFNATYERQISSKAGITIQPYLKLPLADIGYSQVKLQSAGIAVGLSWSFGSSKL
jgi:hypothetical protein